MGRQAMSIISLVGVARWFFDTTFNKSRAVGTSSFNITIEGLDIVAKERSRSAAAGHHYTPPRTLAFEAKVREAVLTKMRGTNFPMFLCPVRMELIFLSPALKRHNKDLIESALAQAQLTIASRWDVDNAAKSISDALNGVLYSDDRQVRQLTVTSRWSSNETSAIHIVVSRIGLSKGEQAAFRKYVSRLA